VILRIINKNDIIVLVLAQYSHNQMSVTSCNDEHCRQSTYFAAQYGHLECLKYAHEDGYGWHPRTTRIAAENGHLECLRYAHENGCEWHPDTTYIAAINGHLECLRYAHGSLGVSCEWHPDTAFMAALNKRLACLMYIYEHCGDVVTWKNARLEKDFEEFPKEIQDYIDSVREDWKCGLNRPGMRTKSVKRNY